MYNDFETSPEVLKYVGVDLKLRWKKISSAIRFFVEREKYVQSMKPFQPSDFGQQIKQKRRIGLKKDDGG